MYLIIFSIFIFYTLIKIIEFMYNLYNMMLIIQNIIIINAIFCNICINRDISILINQSNSIYFFNDKLYLKKYKDYLPNFPYA